MANDIAQRITAFSEIPKIAADTLFPVVEDPDGPGKKTKKAPASKVNINFVRTAAEISAGVTPTNLLIEPGNVLRYGENTTPGTTDMTAAIQAAVNSNDVVVFEQGSGIYSVIGDTAAFVFPTNSANHAVTVPSDTHIIINSGVTVQIKLTTNSNYAAFGCYQKSNIRIDGAGQIIGDLDTHDSGGAGEFGFGIDVRDCDQVIIDGIQVSKCWGDGLFIAAGDPASDATRSTNCQVNNVRSFANRRQGMSVVGVTDFQVNGGIYETTSGTNPQAGIDFEPDGTQRNERVSVNGVNSTGNNIGLLFIKTDFFTVSGGNYDNNSVNMQFDDCKGVVVGASLSGTPSNGHFFFIDDTDRKDVTVRGCDIYIDTGTFLVNYPGGGGNTTLGDQIFDGNTIHIKNAPSTSPMGGNATTDCKQFVNNTLIFESTYALTNLTNDSFITFFTDGWEFSGNRTYNRSSNIVSYDAGTSVTGKFGPMNFWEGPYNEDKELTGYLAINRDLGNIVDGAEITQDEGITGAALGDDVSVSNETDLGELGVTARVQAANTVRVTLRNTSGGAINPPASIFRIKVTRHGG